MSTARAHLAAAGASLVLATALAWPAVTHLVSHVWGDSGDAWQNWWNGWWFLTAAKSGVSPMFTDLLWHPHGVSLWLHAMAPLNSSLTALGQALLPGFAGYNVVVLGHLAFGCYGGFVLARALLLRARAHGRVHWAMSEGAIWWAALGAGAAFGFSPYVWSHVSVHLHLSSVGFVPLFAHALLMAYDRPGFGWPLVCGAWASCTVACGFYLLADEVFIGIAVAAVALVALRKEGAGPVVRVGVSGAVAGALVLPIILPTMRALDQPLDGTHDPVVFSLDALSLWVPAPSQWLGADYLGTTLRFTGNAAENAGYLGYVALVFALVGLLAVRGRWLAGLFGGGVLALVLAFGPHPHVGGRVHHDVDLPYTWLAPVLDGLGCPVRFTLVTTLFLTMGLAAGAAFLAGRLARRAAPGWVVALAAVLPGALAVAEYAPAGQRVFRYPAPEWLALPGESGAVADLTGWTHPLYNQTLHGRPIVHGYIARRPQAYLDELLADPVLGPIYTEILESRAPTWAALTRIDPHLDFDWGAGAPAPEVHTDFRADWEGTLLVPESGEWEMVLGADDSAELFLDGRRAVDNGGRHPYLEVRATLHLEAGPHPVRVRFTDAGHLARLVWRWRGPGRAESVVPQSALTTPDGAPGLLGRYVHRTARVAMPPEEARRHLRERWSVTSFIAYDHNVPWAVRSGLGLERIAGSDGMSWYRVR